MLKDEIKNKEKLGGVVCLIIVGSSVAAIQYGTYLLLICWLQPLIANTVAYFVGFTLNYIASTRYAFRVKSTIKRGVGPIFLHIIGFLLQSVCLKTSFPLGPSKQIALIPMFVTYVPINFLLVRSFLYRR